VLTIILPLALTLWAGTPPAVTYTVRINPAHPDVIDVALALRNVPPAVHLAMKVHAEYDARYWRFIGGLRVEGTARDDSASVAREDRTLWRLTLPGGRGVVHYQVHVQPPAAGLRRAWQTYVRADGALLNPPDVFLYIPELSGGSLTVRLDLPTGWSAATALRLLTGPTEFQAASVATLLDSPMLLGAFHHWRFVDRGTTYHVAYWPLPGAAPFDTLGLVDELHRLARAVLDIFGSAPTPDYWFLIQDGAGDALEHGSSLTIGVPAAELARDPRARVTEIAHEFFHTWNLVAVRPSGYNDLSYRPPARTPGLWLGEGVTMHYADVLARRAGIVTQPSRLERLGSRLEAYFGSPAIMRVPPERASLAFDDPPATNPDATGGYYLQGSLLADVLDGEVRAATGERRGLDDVMRLLYAQSRRPGYRGFTSEDLVAVLDSVCGCSMDSVFARQVAGPGPIDAAPVLRRLGLELRMDSVPAVDSAGRPSPDTRAGLDFTAPAGIVRLVINNPASAFARAGLRTGDELAAIGEAQIGTYSDMRAALNGLRVGDTATIRIRRNGVLLKVPVTMQGYTRPQVRFVNAAVVTTADSARRALWLSGH
jgi:predicted metalloprotease with PDZ domain